MGQATEERKKKYKQTGSKQNREEYSLLDFVCKNASQLFLWHISCHLFALKTLHFFSF